MFMYYLCLVCSTVSVLATISDSLCCHHFGSRFLPPAVKRILDRRVKLEEVICMSPVTLGCLRWGKWTPLCCMIAQFLMHWRCGGSFPDGAMKSRTMPSWTHCRERQECCCPLQWLSSHGTLQWEDIALAIQQGPNRGRNRCLSLWFQEDCCHCYLGV